MGKLQSMVLRKVTMIAYLDDIETVADASPEYGGPARSIGFAIPGADLPCGRRLMTAGG